MGPYRMHILLLHWWGGWEYSHVRIWKKGEATQLIHYNVRDDGIKSRGIVAKEQSYSKSKAFQGTRAIWRAVEMASLVDLLALSPDWWGLVFDLLKHQPLKHFVPTGVRVMGLESLRLRDSSEGDRVRSIFSCLPLSLCSQWVSPWLSFFFKFWLKLERHCAYLSLFRSK